jgi:hypothetical protein
MGCGCKARQEWLNQQKPGLGDEVKKAIDTMREILRPDLKAIFWLIMGAWVAPWVITKVRAG